MLSHGLTVLSWDVAVTSTLCSKQQSSLDHDWNAPLGGSLESGTTYRSVQIGVDSTKKKKIYGASFFFFLKVPISYDEVAWSTSTYGTLLHIIPLSLLLPIQS